MSAALLLTLYVTVDTTRSLLVFGALHSGQQLSPSALTFGAEALKLVVAVVGVLWTTPSGEARFILSNRSPNQPLISYLKPYLRFAIPAALYGCNNVLYLTGLKITSPALLQVCVLTKLPLTALLHHIVIRRRRSQPMWISLGVLTFGLVLAGSPEALWDSSQRGTIGFGDLISGPVIGLTVGIVSACSSVYTELALKEDIGFWQAQTYLYLWGAVFAGFAAIVSNLNNSSSMQTDSTLASLPAFTLVVVVTALTGLVVALILRQRDNLVKLVGSSLCITTVFILQHLLFPLTDGLHFRTTFGIGVLTLATWTYNHYKEIGDDHKQSTTSIGGGGGGGGEYVELSTSEEDNNATSKTDAPDTPGSSFSNHSPNLSSSSPNLSSSSTSSPDMYTPTPTRLVIATGLLIVLSTLTSLSSSTTDLRKGDGFRVERDVKEYFLERKIVPASWTMVYNNREDGNGNEVERNCIGKSFEGLREEEREREEVDEEVVSLGEHEGTSSPTNTRPVRNDELTRRGNDGDAVGGSIDLNEVMAKSNCPVFPVPDEGLITHLFWSGKWRSPSFSLTTDAWLATQRLSSNHRLIWWYENEGPPLDFIDHYTSATSPYRSIVTFERFHEELANGTCLDSMREWNDLSYRREVELPSATRRDLIKLIVLNKFGGIWLNVDEVPLRDLTEVVRAGPSVPTRGDSLMYDMIVAGPPWGGAGGRMLEMACELPYAVSALEEKYPGLRLKDGQLATYSEGVVRLCEAEGCGISNLPVDWLIAHTPSGHSIDACQQFPPQSSSSFDDTTSTFASPVRAEFRDSFLWTMKMIDRSDDDDCWNEDRGTLLSVVRKRVSQVLKEKIRAEEEVREWKGGDLFPRTTKTRWNDEDQDRRKDYDNDDVVKRVKVSFRG